MKLIVCYPSFLDKINSEYKGIRKKSISLKFIMIDSLNTFGFYGTIIVINTPFFLGRT